MINVVRENCLLVFVWLISRRSTLEIEQPSFDPSVSEIPFLPLLHALGVFAVGRKFHPFWIGRPRVTSPLRIDRVRCPARGVDAITCAGDESDMFRI